METRPGRFAEPDVIDRILSTARTIAVVGLSADPARPSHRVAAYLQAAGYRIIPVNPHLRTVLGEPAYPSLREIDEPLDVVDIFRRSEFVAEVTADALASRARAIWMQLGVIDPGSAERAQAAGLDVVMDECMMAQHAARRGRG